MVNNDFSFNCKLLVKVFKMLYPSMLGSVLLFGAGLCLKRGGVWRPWPCIWISSLMETRTCLN